MALLPSPRPNFSWLLQVSVASRERARRQIGFERERQAIEPDALDLALVSKRHRDLGVEPGLTLTVEVPPTPVPPATPRRASGAG